MMINRFSILTLALVAALAILAGHARTSSAGYGIVVNDAPLSADDSQALQMLYGPIPSGRYWYDPVSGLWGMEGAPSSGQIAPGLALGGPLRADASHGDTSVFVNGREIHAHELALLTQQYGYVERGRYWLNAAGVGGFEGGPPIFNLRATAASGGGQGGEPGYNRRAAGGDIGSDGNCFYYNSPGGSSVMSC